MARTQGRARKAGYFSTSADSPPEKTMATISYHISRTLLGLLRFRTFSLLLAYALPAFRVRRMKTPLFGPSFSLPKPLPRGLSLPSLICSFRCPGSKLNDYQPSI